MSSTWLPSLPLEVITRVADFLSFGEIGPGGEQHIYLLRFAQIHPSLCEAAFATLSHQLTINRDLEETREWARICPSKTLKLKFESCQVDDGLTELLSKINFSSVDITFGADERILTAVGACKSIKKLAIRMDTGDHPEVLWSCLGKLQVEELMLDCGCRNICWFDEGEEHKCMFKDGSAFSETYNVLAVCSAGLRVLEVADCALAKLDGNEWPLVEGLEKLERVIVRGEKSLDYREILPENVYVRVSNVWDCDDALSLGDKLLSLEGTFCFAESHLSMLASCVNLEELQIYIERGLEEELAGALRKLDRMRSLCLFWNYAVGEEYATAPPGSVLRIVRAASNVDTLLLAGVKIALREWEDILKCIGSRLRVLSVNVLKQEESAVDRLEALMLLVIKFCPNIRGFHVPDCGRRIWRHERIRGASQYFQGRCPFARVDSAW